MLRMLAFSSTCKEAHIRVYEARAEMPGQYTHPHSRIRLLVGREVCMQIHRVLSIKYSTQGDHVLSPTPRSTRAYLLLPGTYLVWQKENARLPPPPLQQQSPRLPPLYPSPIGALHPEDYRPL